MSDGNRPNAIGAHIYAGGFSLGIGESFKLEGHLETSDFGVKTAQENLRLEVEIQKEGNWKFDRKVNLVYVNPPCVAFSRLGHKEYMEHPTVNDVRVCSALGLRLKPDIFVYECVQQVLTKGKEIVDELAKDWNAAGYHVTVFLSDAVLHGIAQRRKRFHFIASRLKLDLLLPERSSWGGTSTSVLSRINPEVDPKNLQVRRYLQWMEPYAVPGHALRKVWFHLHGFNTNQPKPDGIRFCPPFCIQRLHPDKPSVTLTGGPDFVHPTEWRVLSPGEMAALSGYPESWRWYGNVVDRYKQVAKGVTPAIGKYLGKVFSKALEDGKGTTETGFEVISQNEQADSAWKEIKADSLPPEWKGIAKDNQITKETLPC